MDSLITAGARALARGDPIDALNRVALREDAPALALRGIAIAQLGDLDLAKALLRRAARAFGPKEAVARARCIVAEAEIALVSRDLTWPMRALDAARATLDEHGDRVNASYAGYLTARSLLLIGRLDEAERRLAALDPAPCPPALQAGYELVLAGIALRRIRTGPARAALARAKQAARRSAIPALMAEVESVSRARYASGPPDYPRQGALAAARRCGSVVRVANACHGRLQACGASGGRDRIASERSRAFRSDPCARRGVASRCPQTDACRASIPGAGS
jgi:hypothetical protein